MQYSRKVVDHFHNPRNVGVLPRQDPDVGSGAGGQTERADVARIQVRADLESGRITESRFRAFGCTAVIASTSLATEWATGRTLDEAFRMAAEDIARELELPRGKRHCAAAAVEALRNAIADVRRKRGIS